MTRSPDPRRGALDGVFVLDLARVLAGPYLTRQLADLGADVVKLEPPAGDDSRDIAPKHDRGMSGLFTLANVGKRSISVDLARAEGQALALELAAGADVVVENFRPGVAERLGLGFDAVHARGPRTVYVSLNGYGSDSAQAQDRAYAPVVHAVTGILDDQARFSGQPPAQRRDSHADTLTALHGAIATLAALRVAEQCGVGQHVEVPMFDAVLSTYDPIPRGLVGPLAPGRGIDELNDHAMNPIYDAGPNGAIAVAGSEPYVWRQLLRSVDGIRDPAPPGSDVPTKARLRREAIEAWMRAQPRRDDVLRTLGAAGLAVAPVARLEEAISGPLARERGLLVEVDDRRGGRRPVVRPPARLSYSENRVRGPAPRQGEHNREVLRERLGLSERRIDELYAAKVLCEERAGAGGGR